MSQSKEEPSKLIPAVPVNWLWLPKPLRIALGWVTLTVFALSFLSPIFALILLVPGFWRSCPFTAGIFLTSLILSFVIKPKEWASFRIVGQLWYEIFQFSCNVSPEKVENLLNYCDTHQLILAMHPHGIVPFQAVLWSAYCDQYFNNGKKFMYGFGAAADVVQYVPFLRNFLSWLSASSATYNVLRDGLVLGKSAPVNAAGRKPKHLYILPGGVAEIFCSKPG
jgi:MFS family permease